MNLHQDRETRVADMPRLSLPTDLGRPVRPV